MPTCPPWIASGRWRRSRRSDRTGVFHILCGLSVDSSVEIPLRPCPECPSVRLPVYWAYRIRQWEDTPSLHPGLNQECPPLTGGFCCVASEGGAPFVARRAMNLHGCALPHCAPPPAATPPKGESRRGGPPHSRTNYTPWGTPTVIRTGGTPLPDILHSLGYPHCNKNGGHPTPGYIALPGVPPL